MQRRRFIQAGIIACAAGALDVRAAQTDDIVYAQNPPRRLDVYTPDTPSTTPRPVVVYFFGGGWQDGQRKVSRDIAQALASKGVVAIAPDYRIYPQTIFPGFLDDAAAAVRWARDHAREYGGDPRRIYVMGHSSGAHIAAMIATDPRYLKAQGMSKRDLAGMIGLAGPYAVIPSESHMSDIFPASSRAEALPTAFITGDEPPMLLCTGTADQVVDPVNSQRFADALQARHDFVELKRYEGYGHVTIIDSFSAAQRADSPVLADVLAFIGKANQHANR